MKVAIYARYSTNLQDQTSITGQVANCEALAARESLQVVAKYQDEGISGNDDNRPGYQQLLADLEAGKFVGIVCDETSRITRNPAELHRLIDELEFQDQFLLTCDGIDTRNESAVITIAVKAAIDKMEGRKTGFRVYRSLRERHKDGHSTGGKIFGYTSEQDGNYRRRIIDQEQSPMVKEIFERYANGESAKTIVRDFNERGVPSPGSYWKNVKRRSIGWSHTTLLGSQTKASGILRNRIYKGVDTWNKRANKYRPKTHLRVQKLRPESEWIGAPDESLRIVSDDLWDRVQARLRTARACTSPDNRRGRPPRYLLTGLLICDSCGSHYIVRNGKDYGCSSHGNGRDALCDQRIMIKKGDVEQKLLSGIKEQLLDPKFSKAMAREIRKRAWARPKAISHASELKKLDRQINDLAETICEVGRSDILTAKLRELEERRERLVSQVSSTASVNKIVTGASDKWREIVSNLENLRHYATPDEMESARAEIREIVGEVLMIEKGAHVFAKTKLNENMGFNSGAQKRT